MKIRPAAGCGKTIYEAMSSVVEVADWQALLSYLQEQFYFWSPTNENVVIKPYCYDARTGWDTYMISIDGKAALFSDGPMEKA